MLVSLISVIYLAIVLARTGGDPLTFATLGERYGEGRPNGSEGYDGQFAYYIAVDPTSARAKLDVPAYRYQRILYPLLARALGLGQMAWIPWSLLVVNLVALAMATDFLARILGYFSK